MPYLVTEPHPSVSTSRKSAYLPSGRGGAGNMNRYPTSSLTSGPSATGPASRLSSLPLPPTSAKTLSGRGGAGNYTTKSTTSNTVPTPSPLTQTTSRTSSTSSASSYHTTSQGPERAIFSFDEELARDQRMRDNAARHPVYHIGRGGAGNAFAHDSAKGSARSGSISGSDAGSVASAGSVRRGVGAMVERLSRTLSRS